MKDIQLLPSHVLVHSSDLLQIVETKLTLADPFSLSIDVINIGKDIVTGVYFGVTFKNIHNEAILGGLEFEFEKTSLEILPNRIYYVAPFSLDQRFSDVRGITVRIIKYTTEGGIITTLDKDKQHNMSLPIIPDDKKQKLQTSLAKDIITYGENFIDSWRCVCGVVNGKEEEYCKNCKRSKVLVLNNLSEQLINMKLISNLSKTDTVDKELTMSLSKTPITQVPEKTTNQNKFRKNERIRKDRKKNMKAQQKRIITGLFFLLILSLIGYFLLSKFNFQFLYNHDMKVAQEYLEKGEYEKALKKLESIHLQDDSKLEIQIEEVKELVQSEKNYELGLEYVDKGDTLKALQAFSKVISDDNENYQKSQHYISNLEIEILNKAQRLYDEGTFNDSISLLQNYLNIMPDSAKASNLLNYLESNKKSFGAIPSTPSKNNRGKNTRGDLAKIAKSLVYSFQVIKQKDAYLMSGPGSNYEPIDKLPIESDVYVYEVKIESNKIIWCNVEVKNAKTNEISHGWISHTVFFKE